MNELKERPPDNEYSDGKMAFEPWRESDHDDLLFAVCLALWGWQVQKTGGRHVLGSFSRPKFAKHRQQRREVAL